MKLARLFVYLTFYLHFIACFWWYSTSFNAPTIYYFRKIAGNYGQEFPDTEEERYYKVDEDGNFDPNG